MPPTAILAVVGPSCCGKGVAATALREAGLAIVELSSPLRRLVEPGLPWDVRLRRLSALYRDTHGRLLIDAVLPEIRSASGVVGVIGARQSPEIEAMQAEVQRVRVCAIYAPDDLRFERCRSRARPDAPSTFEDFMRQTVWEYGLGLASIMYSADYWISNTGERATLTSRIVALLGETSPPG